MKKSFTLNGLALAALVSFALTACNSSENSVSKDPQTSVPPDTSSSDPANPKTDPVPVHPGYSTAVMIFNGSGVSTSDWQSTEAIVKSQGLSYQLVNSAQLNAMTLEQIESFGLMVVPGGEGGTIAAALTDATQLRVRQAVRDYGMGYVGFCAGAWIAVGPEADTNGVASYGLAVAKGDVLPSFDPPGNPTATIVNVSFPNGSIRNLVWWGGPSTPEWPNGVVARYNTGAPAISETFSGKGYVVISGPHPEAPQGWRATAGNDSDGLDYDIAIAMFNAALTKQPLSVF